MKIHLIVDKSGSMSNVTDATISGINEYVQSLKSGDVTLTLFDTEVQVKPVVKAKSFTPLNKDTYRPDGMTALYDAVCKTLKGQENNKGKNLVVVMTDGQENSSKEYTQVHMKKMIDDLTAKGNWTFVYLGANQDSYATAGQYGFTVGNTVNYTPTSTGTATAFAGVTQSSNYFAASASGATMDFFDASAKDKIENAE